MNTNEVEAKRPGNHISRRTSATVIYIVGQAREIDKQIRRCLQEMGHRLKVCVLNTVTELPPRYRKWNYVIVTNHVSEEENAETGASAAKPRGCIAEVTISAEGDSDAWRVGLASALAA